MLDRIDKAIINLLLKYLNKHLTTHQIAKKVGISPRTAKKHLGKLEQEGYVGPGDGAKPREVLAK